jgi:hypothetical protein
MEPEGSIYAQTLRHLPDDAPVLVEFKDGRRITGCPRNGPQHKDDGISELYLVYPQARDDDGKLVDIGGEGIIIPLSEVSNIILSADPTGAVSDEADAETQALPPGNRTSPGDTDSQGAPGGAAAVGSDGLQA